MVEIDKWHLIYTIRRIRERSAVPTWEQVAIPAAAFLAVLLGLLPNDFRDFLSVPAATWQMLAIFVAILSVIATGVLGARWLTWRTQHPHQTDEEVYIDLIRQMEEEAEKFSQPDDGNYGQG